jgi:hypothetical protein
MEVAGSSGSSNGKSEKGDVLCLFAEIMSKKDYNTFPFRM